jgi:hypothetical protein
VIDVLPWYSQRPQFRTAQVYSTSMPFPSSEKCLQTSQSHACMRRMRARFTKKYLSWENSAVLVRGIPLMKQVSIFFFFKSKKQIPNSYQYRRPPMKQLYVCVYTYKSYMYQWVWLPYPGYRNIEQKLSKDCGHHACKKKLRIKFRKESCTSAVAC